MRILDVTKDSWDDIAIKLFLNGVNVADRAWRARVPNKHGILGVGWADMYIVNGDGKIVFDEKLRGPVSRRHYGFVKTMPEQ